MCGHSRPESEHDDQFIPNELLVGKKLNSLIALLLFLEKLSFAVAPLAERSELFL